MGSSSFQNFYWSGIQRDLVYVNNKSKFNGIGKGHTFGKELTKVHLLNGRKVTVKFGGCSVMVWRIACML